MKIHLLFFLPIITPHANFNRFLFFSVIFMFRIHSILLDLHIFQFICQIFNSTVFGIKLPLVSETVLG